MLPLKVLLSPVGSVGNLCCLKSPAMAEEEAQRIAPQPEDFSLARSPLQG